MAVINGNNGLAAEKTTEMFSRANQAFLDNDYQKAAQEYLSLLKLGFINPDLHYNLANSYYQMDQLGKARLHLEKALKISPGHKMAKENIDFILSKLSRKKNWQLLTRHNGGFSALMQMIESIDMNLLAAIFLLLNGLLWISMLILKIGHIKIIYLAKRVAIPLAIMAFLVAIPFAAKIYAVEKMDYGIIITEDCQVKEGPDKKFTPTFKGIKGLKVRVLSQENKWFKIKTPSGLEGWLPNNLVEII